eukprot:15620283-Heterocapsa_arctica.AAC.1
MARSQRPGGSCSRTSPLRPTRPCSSSRMIPGSSGRKASRSTSSSRSTTRSSLTPGRRGRRRE